MTATRGDDNAMGMTSDEDWDRLVGEVETVRAVFEDMPTMLCALKGPQHRFVAANAAYRAVYPKVRIGDFLPDIAPEASGQNVFEVFDRVYQTGEPLVASEWRVQVDLDGTGVQEKFFNMVVHPWRQADGTIVGLLLAIAEVTEQVRARFAAEQRASEMTGRFVSLRDSATVMQRALLAHGVTVLPGADIAAAYLVAGEDTAAGGDWFDAMPDPTGTVVLVVGDVVGHGVHAAAVMAQLRTATRMQLSTGAGIGQSLEAVDRFAADVAGAKSATVCVVRLNPTTGDLDYCTAGHPPPLVIGTDGTPRYLEPTGAGPLGSGRGFATRTAHLGVGDVVLLYSDGIIERPGRSPSASTAEVAYVTARVLGGQGFPLAPPQAPVQRLCSQALELLVRPTGYSDDVTLLAAQRRLPPPPLHVVLRADAHAEPTIRTQLRSWLRMLGADHTSGDVLEHAVSELVTNAAEHAYHPTSPGEVMVDADLGHDGRVRASVADHGTWKPPTADGAGRGRGLMLAQLLVPDTVIRHDQTGTTAAVTHRLTRAADIVTDPQAIPGTAIRPRPEVFDIGASDDGHVVLTGDIDTEAASTLAGFLAQRSHAGAKPIHIDLSAVTHLGSAGINVLAEACERAARQHSTCTLVAPPGGPAHHVLTLVGLPNTDETATTLDE